MNKYNVEYENQAIKQFQKLDKYDAKKIYQWIGKNLVGCTNPYAHGKALKGNLSNCWRYRVGNYRLLAEIDNQKITIIIVSIGHRKEVYD